MTVVYKGKTQIQLNEQLCDIKLLNCGVDLCLSNLTRASKRGRDARRNPEVCELIFQQQARVG